MTFAAVGGFQLIGTQSLGNSYGSWPWAARDAALNVHLVFRDWDGVTVGAHSTGGAAWYSRNGGVPAKFADATSEGNQIQDTWVLPLASGNLAFILRLFKGTATTDFRHRYAISTDAGVTIPATATMPAPTGTPANWTDATGWAFGDFLRSADGTKWYGVAYDGVGNVYVLQSTNGFNWAYLSTVSTSGSEASLIRMSDGRIVCGIRHVTNSNPGWTSFSDNDATSWSAAIQPNSNATSVFGNNFCIVSPPRGRAVGNNIVILGRWLDGTGNVWNAQWVVDRAGAYVSGPVKITGTNSSSGGYFCFSDESAGLFTYGYSDFGTNGGDAQVFKARCKLSG